MNARLLALALLAAAACSDDSSPAGPAGSAGDSGAAGQAGASGQSGASGKSGASGQAGAGASGQAGAGASGQSGAGASGQSGAGSGGAGGSEGIAPPATLTVGATPWNPKKLDVGKVAAVAEQSDRVVLFGDLGVQVIAGGAVAATDASNKSWKSAAVLPAADGAGEWVVGLDGKGQLYRLTEQGIEGISGRYGLDKEAVSAVARAGQSAVLFATPTGLAVADGQKVTRYDLGAITALAGREGQAAAVTAAGVVVLDLTKQQGRTFALPSPSGAVFDSDGRLVVAAGGRLLAQQTASPDAELQPIYEGDAPIAGLVSAGDRTWFLAGGELGTTTGVVARTASLKLPAATLAAGVGGVWVLSAGEPQRFAPGGSPDETDWYNNVLPAFARACSLCHKPGGSSGHDYSTYASWAAGRAKILTRVDVKKNMPPSGNPISDADRAAIVTWCKQTP